MIRPPLSKGVSLLFLIQLLIQPALSANKSSAMRISPISFPASELWYVALAADVFVVAIDHLTNLVPRDGNDGPWSSFYMQVGTPAQNLRLLPSSSDNAIWPVLPQGCTASDPSDCGDLRGTIFRPNSSSTWINIGLYGLVLTEEAGLGYSGNANFGYDNITLGWKGGGLPTLSHQVIEGFASTDFLIGSFGLCPHAVNISNPDDPKPSFLGALAQLNQTPSTSWAYTAGAYYRQPTAFGSLTLGGYDTTRFIENDVTFPFGPDTSRDLIVPIQSITATTPASSHLLSDVIYAYIDSLVPHIWLPLEVCKAFERAFGLTYNETAELYLVNETLHDRLLSQNPNVTFTLGAPGSTKNNTVDIVMHYGSFDLMADYPTVNNAVRYFPLKQAHNNSQYTLGRAFLQDAYVIADYDRSNFSVSQAVFPNGSNTQQIVAIHRPGDTLPSTYRKVLSKAAIAGIAVAAILTLFSITAAIIVHGIRKKNKNNASKLSSEVAGMDEAEAEPGSGGLKENRQSVPLEMPVTDPKELAADEARRPELPTQAQVPLPEMPVPTPELEHHLIARAESTQGHRCCCCC